MPLALIIFLFVLGMAVIGVVVAVTLLASLVRGVARFLFGKPAAPIAIVAAPSHASVGAKCARVECNAANPAHAQFCRRCGEPLPARSRVTARRVA